MRNVVGKIVLIVLLASTILASSVNAQSNSDSSLESISFSISEGLVFSPIVDVSAWESNEITVSLRCRFGGSTNTGLAIIRVRYDGVKPNLIVNGSANVNGIILRNGSLVTFLSGPYVHNIVVVPTDDNSIVEYRLSLDNETERVMDFLDLVYGNTTFDFVWFTGNLNLGLKMRNAVDIDANKRNVAMQISYSGIVDDGIFNFGISSRASFTKHTWGDHEMIRTNFSAAHEEFSSTDNHIITNDVYIEWEMPIARPFYEVFPISLVIGGICGWVIKMILDRVWVRFKVWRIGRKTSPGDVYI